MVLSSFLRSGITFASFNLSGNMPVANICVIGLYISILIVFKSFTEILQLSLGCNIYIVLQRVSSSTGLNRKA